ncbi:uncharacterized protein LOC128388594 isoform X2 [Panonychus citri]|nr:uncharacterized protein LOC128388594 isoform X2 [Panonychus citri]
MTNNSTTVAPEGQSSSSLSMLSSSKSATLITCSSSFTSESSLTMSTENLRASPDLGSSAATLSTGGDCPSGSVGYSKGLSSCNRNSRTPSAGSLLLSVPNERYGLRRFSMQSGQRFSLSPTDTLFEEQSELILNCGALSSAVLGRIKSFSTSDITMTSNEFDSLHDPTFSSSASSHLHPSSSSSGNRMKNSLSEIVLFGAHGWDPRLALPNNIRSLDATSRSCSTWVIVGDRSISSVSQLPSPSQAHSVSGTLSPTLHPLDIVFSMNKKVRQMYIRQRLLSTYRTLERLSRSHLDLGNIIKGDLVNKLTNIHGLTTKTTMDSNGVDERAIEGGENGGGDNIKGPSIVNSFNKLNNKSIDTSSPSSSSVITHNESTETKEPFSNQSFNLSNPVTRSTTTTFEAQSNQFNNDPNCLSNLDDDPIKMVDCNSINLDDTDINNNNNCTNYKTDCSSSILKLQDRLASTSLDLIQLQNDLLSLSVRDIELQKGKPLTKYERNMMIFDWLQNLDQEEPN